LEQVIHEKKEEFSVSSNISVNMVRSQIKQWSLASTHPGINSPLYKAALALVEICIHMGKICQPLTADKAIVIMNDLIRETEISETLTEFQKVCTSCSERHGLVGRNWWWAFK